MAGERHPLNLDTLLSVDFLMTGGTLNNSGIRSARDEIEVVAGLVIEEGSVAG